MDGVPARAEAVVRACVPESDWEFGRGQNDFGDVFSLQAFSIRCVRRW